MSNTNTTDQYAANVENEITISIYKVYMYWFLV